jgi:inner membrane protein
MASFGHLAVGMMAGRLHCGGQGGPPGRSSRGAAAAAIFGFALLAMLPDADVLMVALGVSEGSAGGHRGASHSLLTALAIGLIGGLLARRLRWNGIRTAVAIVIALASHGLLDALGQGGRAIPLFWPLSAHRFMAPWRILPDAPRGVQFLSRHGFYGAALEFLYFLPFTAYALWPRRTDAPALTVVDGGAKSAPLPASAPAAEAASAPPRPSCPLDADDQPALRSSG